MSNVRVLLVYGGQSSEHDVSIASARNVFAALDNTKYDLSTCLIDKQGRWWLLDGVDDYHAGSPQLLPVLGQKKFVTLPDHKIVQPDVILPILHGKNGEDGTIQGLAELLGIPCAGPSVLGAAVSMNKVMTKQLLRQVGLPVVEDVVWQTYRSRPDYAEISRKLGPTLFVKPSASGSSVGVSKVMDGSEFGAALDEAALHDETVLIERAVKAREIEVAVLGNDEMLVSHPGEIIPGEEYYSYEDKYAAGSRATLSIPADIPGDTAEIIKRYAARAYRVVGGRGMARVDFFLADDGKIFVNEINSIPGFTNISMYPKLFRHAGVPYPKLIDRLIELALE